MLSVNNSESFSRAVIVPSQNGGREEIMHIGCTMRPGSGLYLSADIHNADKVAENKAEVEAVMAEFFAEAMKRAAAVGLPVPAAGGGADA